jgi:hypothetical protein
MTNPFVYYALKSPHVKIDIRKIISFNRRSDVSKVGGRTATKPPLIQSSWFKP